MQDENPNVIQPNQPQASDAPAATPVSPTYAPLSPSPTPPVAPVSPQFSEPPRQPFMPATEPTPRSRKRLIWFIVALVVVLGLAAGYTFAFFLPAQPGNMYKSGLTNTGKALDKLITYSDKHKVSDYKSASFTGSAQVKSAEGSFDFDVSGSVDKKGNSNATV